MEKEGNWISRYYSDDGLREAVIVKNSDDGKYNVLCYSKDVNSSMKFDRVIDVTDHSFRYAEDTAENWVSYIIRT
jgi:hypothetical protein